MRETCQALPFETVAEVVNRRLAMAGSSVTVDRNSARRVAAGLGLPIERKKAIVEVRSIKKVDGLSADHVQAIIDAVLSVDAPAE